MKNLAIKVEHLSKAYQLGQIGTGTISRDLERWWATRVMGKEDPFLKIGQTNDRTVKGESDIVWSLRDLNFEVEPGDAVGVIGRNGAGKSTLLKILSKFTAPTTGSIKLKGRVASLLEVGTGFHPELTGRENIFLNGAILGMRKAEIKRRFDEIVDFSGVERYIDTPVKRYSSGMYVRLAFAVAAHLESEILIVDEVLAVGDAEFQKKCLGKMGEVSNGEGRTVLFVSHNMAAVQSFCKKGILLENGEIVFNGDSERAIDLYTSSGLLTDSEYFNNQSGENQFNKIIIMNTKGISQGNFKFEEQIKIEFRFKLNQELVRNTVLGLRVSDQRGRNVFSSQKSVSEINKDSEGTFISLCEFPEKLLAPNIYKITVALHIPNAQVISFLSEVVSFSIEETGTDYNKYYGQDVGCVIVNCNWY